MHNERWEFWIDVGGTFTDCLARLPDGTFRRSKLLSSGVVKGLVRSGSTHRKIIDPQRANDPAGFWTGWSLAILDSTGKKADSGRVVGFMDNNATLQVEGLIRPPAPGTGYELHSSLEAPIVAIRYLLGIPLDMPLPPLSLRLGTTRGTNALLTRTGARTAFVTTRGFGDMPEIGYQARPRLFDLTVRKQPPLADTVLEINERITQDGVILVQPNRNEVRRQLQEVRDRGIESLAICFLHADRYPQHEQLVAEEASRIGFREISSSHTVAPLPKFVPRADTTILDAYLNPVLRDYVTRLQTAMPGSQLCVLTSAGGLIAGEQFTGKDSVLSGPAGGVVGVSHVARATGFDRAIGFDMGGTSTDVSRYDGRFEREHESEKAGVRLVTPTMAIETVAAGGGSICRFDGMKLTVGPDSAGADPGPACYGRGGPLTVTDVNLLLGRIVADRFPFPLNRRAAELKLREIVDAISNSQHSVRERIRDDQVAHSLLKVANARMAAAIRLVTVAKGANPSDYALVAFGGAAGQHACAIARELGITAVLSHPEGGILSALGIGLADITRQKSCGIEQTLNEAAQKYASQRLDELQQAATEELVEEGLSADRITATRTLDMRYRGVDSVLSIPWGGEEEVIALFEAEHQRRYGYIHSNRRLEIVAAHIEVIGQDARSLPKSEQAKQQSATAVGRTSAYFDEGWIDAPLFERHRLAPGDRIEGPAIITEDIATTVIECGWKSEVLTQGELLTTEIANPEPRRGSAGSHSSTTTSSDWSKVGKNDPGSLEVFNNLFASIAKQMGVTLRNTAISVNVKERLDFSCAVFTADGRLVANAPHVPVHLGAMEETVRQTIATHSNIRVGDVFATNDPYAGGSHLPDVTVVTPVHDSLGRLMFFVASRAHHAEIGGMTPGSMPPHSKTLADEGVLIRNQKIVERGEPRFAELRDLLASGPYPSRDIATNLADIEAQVAANRQGVLDLLTMVDRYSLPIVEHYMNLIQDAAEQKVREALSKLPDGRHEFTDFLETADGKLVPIHVTWTIHKTQRSEFTLNNAQRRPQVAATIDFTGTGGADEGNLNANRAIVTAAVIYVLRLLLDEDIPLNHGVLRPLEIILPRCLLNPVPGPTPETSPAVAGGNVETSQRVVDVLLGALGVAAASQGTMNNVIFGDDRFGYYETICGGSGATADGHGASAVQVHMTNTRLTDPEILERRFPVRVREFALRHHSGGSGYHRGGDGVVRRLEFLRPLTVSLLTQRRGNHPPFGMAGGRNGSIGRNALLRRTGGQVDLPAIAQIEVEEGDVLVIETPGGGGFGTPPSES